MNTMQFEFDAVVAHLYKQGKRSMKAGGGYCAYRGTDGMMCAVGCRIPDDKYLASMDESGLGGGLMYMISNHANLPQEIYHYKDLFKSLQITHDSCPTSEDRSFVMEALEDELKRVASRFDLTFTKPQ